MGKAGKKRSRIRTRGWAGMFKSYQEMNSALRDGSVEAPWKSPPDNRINSINSMDNPVFCEHRGRVEKQTSPRSFHLNYLIDFILDQYSDKSNSKMGIDKLSIIDFGPGTGYQYNAIRSAIEKFDPTFIDRVDYTGIEMSHFVEYCNGEFADNDKVRYFHLKYPKTAALSSLYMPLDLGDIDILHARASLMFLGDPWQDNLRRLIATKPRHIVLDYTVCATKTRLSIYGYSEFTEPYWLLGYDDLINFVCGEGYKLKSTDPDPNTNPFKCGVSPMHCDIVDLKPGLKRLIFTRGQELSGG